MRPTVRASLTTDEVAAGSLFADELRLTAIRAEAERYRRQWTRWVSLFVIETTGEAVS
jgi:hypothetical protein